MRIEKIKGNLKLINEIMQINRSGDYDSMFYNGGTGCYIPLPNHNYNHSGKVSVRAIPAKTQFYKIGRAQ